jgi:hypothetical protein
MRIDFLDDYVRDPNQRFLERSWRSESFFFCAPLPDLDARPLRRCSCPGCVRSDCRLSKPPSFRTQGRRSRSQSSASLSCLSLDPLQRPSRGSCCCCLLRRCCCWLGAYYVSCILCSVIGQDFSWVSISAYPLYNRFRGG